MACFPSSFNFHIDRGHRYSQGLPEGVPTSLAPTMPPPPPPPPSLLPRLPQIPGRDRQCAGGRAVGVPVRHSVRLDAANIRHDYSLLSTLSAHHAVW